MRKNSGKLETEQGEIVQDSRPRNLRWIRLLREYATSHSYRWLENAIEAANPNDEKWRIDDDKLKRIVTRSDGNVSLTLNEITALDRFFAQLGEGSNKKGLFERSILEPVSHFGKVCFILGASPDRDEVTNVVRRWDSQAMAEIVAALTHERERIRVEVRDVLRNAADQDTSVGGQPWYKHLFYPQDDSPSLISIGSPLANPASEWMLAKMFSLKPFQKTFTELPFHFVWPPRVNAPYPSSFAMDVRMLESMSRNDAKKVVEDERGLLRVRANMRDGKVYETFHPSTRLQQSGKAPAIIVAQQRRNGQILIMVAGVSGPGTLAAARYLATAETYSLPEPEGAHDGNLWIGVVESDVSRHSHHNGDDVEIGETKLLCGFIFPVSR